jgi:hypothetical protein
MPETIDVKTKPKQKKVENPNNEPIYLRPLIETLINKDALTLLELTTSVPTLFITEEQCQLLVDSGVNGSDAFWKLAVNGVNQEMTYAGKPLSDQQKTALTGTADLNKISTDFEYRVVILSPGLPPAIGVRRLAQGNDPQRQRPHIRCNTSSGSRIYMGAEHLYGMLHIMKADLYKLYTDYDTQPWLAKKYADLGFNQDDIEKFFRTNVKKGWLEEPVMEYLDEVSKSADPYRTMLMQAAFQLLFDKDETTKNPIDKSMAMTVENIRAGNFTRLQNEKLVQVLYKRILNHADYQIDLSSTENPSRPYITEAQLRAFLIEYGMIGTQDNMKEVAAEIRELLSTMNCMLPYQPQEGKAHMYISLTPGYSTVLSSDGRMESAANTRPLQREYCEADDECPHAQICKRKDELGARHILPDAAEKQQSLPVMQDFMEYVIESFSKEPFHAVLVLPRSGIRFEFNDPLLTYKSNTTKRRGLLGKPKSDNPNLPNPFGFKLHDETFGYPGLTQQGARMIDPGSLGRKGKMLKQLLKTKKAEAYIDPRAPGKIMIYFPETGAYDEASPL